MVRRSAYLDVGGFDPRLGVGAEEQLLALDLREHGHRLQYLPDVVAYHHPSANRDRSGRQRQLARNRLWAVWLRRPGRVALAATARAGRRALADADTRAGLRAAVGGLGWVARERHVVGLELEAQVRALERAGP